MKAPFLWASGLALVAVALAYQNCSVQPSKMSIPGQLGLSELANGAPFAYDVKADTFSYMSCSSMTTTDETMHFSVRVGALNAGSGVALSDKFRTYASNNELSKDEQELLLSESPWNRGAWMQLSVRVPGNLPGAPVGPGGYPSPVRVFHIWGSLSESPLSNTLAHQSAGERIRLTDKYLIGQVNFTAVGRDNIQSALNQNALTVLGFGGTFYSDQQGNDINIISNYEVPSEVKTPTKGVYGRGYVPSFGSPRYRPPNGTPRTLAKHGKRAAVALAEKKVEAGEPITTLSNWACPIEAIYTIVPKSKVVFGSGKLNDCDLNADADTLSDISEPLYSREIKARDAAKKLLGLYPSRWIVDQRRHCAIYDDSLLVPGGFNGCYTENKVVDWDFDEAQINCDGQANEICPEFFSVCASYLDP